MRWDSLNSGRRLRHATLAAYLAVGVGTAGALIACAPTSRSPAPVRITVPNGASFRAAADSLAHAGVISWPTLFRLYARLQGRDRRIQAGTYLLRRDLSWNDALGALHDGKGLISKVTIPEGYSLAQILPLLQRALHVPAESLDAAVRDSALRARLHVPTPTLEGYLFPDTYLLPPGTSARRAVGEMVRRFEQEWTAQDEAQLATLGLTRHQVMTMASIVEKEAKVPAERPVIAGVYYNRLHLGMPLQADPTVQYALGKHVDRLLYKDLDVPSPYNTYQNAGLPPGPIASPGGPSIEAALRPASVPYLYFVAAPDGHHEFRSTLEEHANAIQAIRRAQVALTTRARRDSANETGGQRPSGDRGQPRRGSR
jgi:UPF0755 protein